MIKVWSTLLLILFASLVASVVVAKERLVFDNFSVRKSEGVYKMDVDTNIRIRKQPRDALQKGVSLYFTMNIAVIKQRNFWPDATVSAITRRYRLFYFDLTRHYRVTELSTGKSYSFLTLEEAIDQLGTVRDLPIIEIDRVKRPSRYRVNIEMSLDISELPAPLQLQAYTTRRWLLRSEETEWPLVE